MTSTLIALLAGFVVTAVCVTLVLHQDYEDGLIGRVGLSLIALASMTRFLGAADALISGEYLHLSPVALTLWSGLAIFLARHLWRFMWFKRSGKYDWRTTTK